MKFLIPLIFLCSTTVFSKDLHQEKHEEKKEEAPVIDVKVLNSPVLEQYLKLSISVPKNFEIDRASYKIVNSFKVKELMIHERSKKDPSFDKRKLLEVTKTNSGYLAQIDLSSYNPGNYRLILSVVDKKSRKSFHCRWAKMQKLIRDYVNFTIDSKLEVKDPGEAGKKTLLGIDSDNDGIRDDVQRMITMKFANNPTVKDAAKQYARGLQEVMATSGDKEASILAHYALGKALDCLESRIGSDVATQSLSQELMGEMVNTYDRIQNEQIADKNMAGQGMGDEYLNMIKQGLSKSSQCQ